MHPSVVHTNGASWHAAVPQSHGDACGCLLRRDQMNRSPAEGPIQWVRSNKPRNVSNQFVHASPNIGPRDERHHAHKATSQPDHADRLYEPKTAQYYRDIDQPMMQKTPAQDIYFPMAPTEHSVAHRSDT